MTTNSMLSPSLVPMPLENSPSHYEKMDQEPRSTFSQIHSLSTYLVEPYNVSRSLKAGNCSTAMLGALGMCLSFPMALAGKTIQYFAEKSSNAGYTYLSGNHKEECESKEKYMSLNVATLFHTTGLRPGRSRIQGIANLINEEKPHILCLQDITTSDGYTIASLCCEEFSHFYLIHGITSLQGFGAGLLFACRTPIEGKPYYQPLQIAPYKEQEGFFLAKTPHVSFINMNLNKESMYEKVRQAKILQQTMQDQSKPCIAFGSLTESRGVYSRRELENALFDQEKTATNRFKRTSFEPLQKTEQDAIFLLDVPGRSRCWKRDDTHKNLPYEEALTDHDAIFVEVDYAKEEV